MLQSKIQLWFVVELYIILPRSWNKVLHADISAIIAHLKFKCEFGSWAAIWQKESLKKSQRDKRRSDSGRAVTEVCLEPWTDVLPVRSASLDLVLRVCRSGKRTLPRNNRQSTGWCFPSRYATSLKPLRQSQPAATAHHPGLCDVPPARTHSLTQ